MLACMDALDCTLALARAPGLTASHLRRAQQRLAAGADSASDAQIASLIGLAPRRLRALELPEPAIAALALPPVAQLAADRDWALREHIVLLHALDERYPPLLGQLADAPAVLYVRGDVSALCAPQLAIVGTRQPTTGGARTAQELAAALAQAGLTITSGLALGIDAASHAGALAVNGDSIAVLACGLDCVYPPEHAQLASRIAAHGALLSEFAPRTPPLRRHFPRRNRLISGLSLGTLVVEATRRSGSLITARTASAQGRRVFAVPGSIHNPLARGCHALIRSGAARLIESAADILQDLEITDTEHPLIGTPAAPRSAAASDRALDNDYKILLDALGHDPASMDLLVERSGLPSPAVACLLLTLELEGHVELQADGRYLRLERARRGV